MRYQLSVSHAISLWHFYITTYFFRKLRHHSKVEPLSSFVQPRIRIYSPESLAKNQMANSF